tara:strand:+ start:820 stop:1425 length:606 start_codon:yes stop_codon:yes gene_type:complete
MLKLLIPVAAMTIAVAPALADSTERTWTQEPDQLIHVDSSDAGKDPNFKSLVRIIKAEGGDHPTIQLSCQITTSGYKALNFSVQLDPENTYEDDADRSPRFHHISGIMEVRDEKFPDRYAFHAKSTKLIPLSREVPSRIYNSVVRGDQVQLKVKGKKRDLALPEKNDVFVAFAKFCPVTNGGKFDASVFNTLKGMELTPNL